MIIPFFLLRACKVGSLFYRYHRQGRQHGTCAHRVGRRSGERAPASVGCRPSPFIRSPLFSNRPFHRLLRRESAGGGNARERGGVERGRGVFNSYTPAKNNILS